MRPSARTAPWHGSSVGLGRGIGAFIVLAVVAAGGSLLQAQGNGDGQAQGNAAGDRAALVALYNATDGPNWVDNTNWLTDQPLSQWRGVITDGEGRVFGLVLVRNGLSGKLPVELGKLTRLTQLFLLANDLSGPIPAELGKLTRLTRLQLASNDLSGPIPAELGNLTELWSLRLSNNRLSGRIPAQLGKLTRLRTLSLNDNRLIGAFPPELATLSSLQTLHLKMNAGLAGALPEALRNISALRDLQTEGTQLCAPRDTPFQEWLKTISFSGSNCLPESNTDSPTVIDVAVFYTPASVKEYRRPYGYQQFRATVDLMFLETNLALAASGVKVEFSLVGLEEVTYVERGSRNEILEHFANDSDGEMDEIHDERDRFGADIAILLSNHLGLAAGVAYIASGASRAFGMVRSSKSSTFAHGLGSTFAHELGHIMGVAHDRYVYRNSASPWAAGGTHAYSYGYVNQRAFDESADTSTRWRTIMAYDDQCSDAGFSCFQAMRFSNPDQEFRADPLGVAGDQWTVAVDGPANAVRTMNERRETVANWRTRPEGFDPSAATVSFDPPEITVAEGKSATLRVRLSRSLGHPVTVSLSHGAGQFAGGSEGSDYSALPSSVTFESDQTEVPVEIQAIDDSLVEGAEGVVLEISESNLPWGLMIGSNPTATVSIQDNDLPQGPVVTTGPALVVEEGQTAVATLAATDTDTPATQLTWSIPSGSAGGTDGHLFALSAGGQLAFLAAKDYESPDDADQDGAYEVTVQVTDGSTPVTAAIQIRLANRNEEPTADAGADQSNVAEGASVTLAGSGTDPDADDVAGTLQFLWRQTDTGPHRVTLSNSNAASATFTAPSGLTADAVLRFALTVTDDGSLSGEDEVEVTVRRSDPPEVSISASSDQVAEGAPVAFEVTLDKAAPEALTVAVSVTENGSALSGTPPASLAFAKGATSATLSVPTAGDTVVESDSIVTATVTAGTGYTVGSTSSATVTVEDNDTATFTVSAVPEAITEGESATLTVGISNGVSFAEAQTISLAASGTASASDYTGLPASLTLAAGASSVTATLAASADQEEEDAETVTVTASRGGSTIGSATVTINSVSDDATLATLSLPGIDIGTFSGSTTSYQASVANSVTATTVTATATHAAATVTIEPGSRVTLAEGANTITVTVTAEDGATTETYTITVRRAALPTATIAAGTTAVTEGTAATYSVTLDTAAPEALTVAVSVTENGSALSGTPPASVAFAKGATSATLRVPTAGDTVVESDSTVTATVTTGTGYSVGSTSSATVTVEDNDTATFTVSAIPEAIAEGESATLTVAISNGVTFAEAQTISLAASGTASASDYTGLPTTLTLAAGVSSVTATLAAAADQEEEDAETVTVTASHGGSTVGSATVTINSVSDDATLAALSLSGIDIGTFSGSTTSYQASVANSVTTTTVTATATHAAATVTIEPGSRVTLAEGANTITVTVTAEDGATTETYAITVRRAALPTATIAAGTTAVTEGTAATYSVTLDTAAPEALTVAVSVTENGSALSGTPPTSVAFAKGATSATLRVPTAGDTVVESDSIVTATVTAGTGYTVGSTSSATVTVEDNDTATFTVSAIPEAIAEGESATLTVAISNGVSFMEAQTISLAASGTASASDYSGVPSTLTLAAGASSVTATLAASADQQEEDAETVTVTASRSGSTIGSATVTINSISRDATLATLSLSSVDIGTFSGSVTSYQASVPNSVTSTTVTATASHSGASVSIDPGSEVALAEGANQIRVTVTAGDGTTRKNYTVTVRRAVLPVVSIAAVEGRERGPVGEVRVSRTGPTAEPLDVQVHITSTSTPETVPMTFRFRPGQSSMTRGVDALGNKLVEDDITVTWTVQDGEGYTVSGEHASASVVLEEPDVPEFSVTVKPAEIAEGESATVTVATTNGVTFAEDQTISVTTSGTASTSEYTGLPPTLTLPAGASSVTATLAASPDQEEEDAETVTVTASHEGSEIGSATVTIAASESPLPLTAKFAGMPATHDGETAFKFELRFSEKIVGMNMNDKLLNTAFEVTGGSIRRVRRVRNPPRHLNLRWTITVEPASDADVVLALPVTTDCNAKRAVCTAGGKGLSQRVTATVKGPSEVEAAGFPLAPENSRPSGIWSDGQTAWVADLDDARLYAYRRSDGEREPERDIATEPAPMGLWSDGKTLWVAGLGGGLRAHGLADGSRQALRDLALEANTAPAGVWSDGETAWVADWLGDTVHAYRLSDGRRVADREIKLDGGNLLPVGLWSDGETLWVADWREWVYAYRLSDGGRDPARDVVAARADTDPTGLWSSGELLLATGWEDGQVRAYRLPTAESPAQGKDQSGGLPARAASIPPVADPALRAAIGAALGKAPGESVSGEELARLESLEARDAGIRDLAGLESATSLTVLDLGFNPLADLRPLAALPALEHLNLDGAIPDLQDLAALTGLKRLSLRHNGIRNLGILAGLTRLEELDAGDNLIEDLRPLSGLGQLEVLRADRNRIADLWPLASLARLEVLELGSNRIGDLQPLAGLAGLRKLRLAGNQFAELHPLSGLDGLTDLGLAGNAVEDLRALSDLGGLRRLDLRGNPVGDLRPLQALRSLAWVHVGGSRIEDLAPLNGVPSLTVAGRDDLQPPEAVGGGAENSNRD